MDNINEPEDGQDSEWAERIAAAEKDNDQWWERCKKIKDIYRDRRDKQPAGQDAKKFNILWSNIQTTSPVLYARLPIPVVMAKDFIKDENATLVSTALKRTLSSEIKEYDFDGVIKEAVLEYQLTARGTVWIAYNPQFQTLDQIDEGGNPQEIKTDENCYAVFVNHKDFIHSKARVWEEVTWVGRRLELTKKECKENFPDKADSFVYGEKTKLCFWEVWNKTTGEQLFIAPDQPTKIVKKVPVPIDFQDFFPCPKPLYANLDNETLIPTPDYIQYQDQAGDLNKYTNRLSRLGDAIKVRGVYNSVNTTIQNLFDENQENVLMAVSTPLDGKLDPFQFVPIEVFAEAAIQTAQLKDMVKQDIYELTGLSDIIRGSSNPDETATAQNIKNQWGSLRVKEKQKDVQRFIRDILRLKAEVIAEHFSVENIEKASGVKLTPEAEKMMRDGVLRTFMIDIETDSTIEPDAQQEKQDRTEFMTALAGYLNTGMDIASKAPELAPMLSELVMFGLRAFPVGQDMEQSIKEALAKMVEAQNQKAQNPQPDPEIQKAQLNSQTTLQVEDMKSKTTKEVEAMKIQGDKELKAMDINGQHSVEDKKAANQNELTRMGLKSTEKLARVKAKSGTPEAGMQTDNYGITDEEEEPTKLDQLAQSQMGINDKLDQAGQILIKVAQTLQQSVAQNQQILGAVTAEKELIRDPKTGRAKGARIKPGVTQWS